MNLIRVLPRREEACAKDKVFGWVLGKWFDHACEEYLERVYQCCEGMELSWHTISQRLDFFCDCVMGAEVSLEISVSEVSRHSVLLGCRINQNGNLCAIGSRELESRDLIHQRPMPLIDSARQSLEREALGFLRMTA
jgi:acyl-CoA thioesterase FadM